MEVRRAYSSPRGGTAFAQAGANARKPPVDDEPFALEHVRAQIYGLLEKRWKRLNAATVFGGEGRLRPTH